MKLNITLIALALGGSATFFSCKKSSSSTPVYTMTATVNGVAFNATNCYADTSGGNFNIYGGNFAGKYPDYPFILLSLSLGNYTGAGTYALGTTWMAMGWVDSSNAVQPASIRGTVDITAVSPEVTGTFSFVCGDSTTVTNGSFKAKVP